MENGTTFIPKSSWKCWQQILDVENSIPFLKEGEIDLFTSRLSAQLSKYVRGRLDPEALHADALTMNWAPFKGYEFPLSI